jgi:hypothetical protein
MIIIYIIIYIIFIIYIYRQSSKKRLKGKICYLDIDDTLLKSQIYTYININGKIIKLTPEEYKKYENKYPIEMFDFSEFDDPEIIKKSIINSTPIYENLRIVNNHINDKWELGILTARGEEEMISQIIEDWLKKNLKREDFKIKRDNIYAVGDKILKYKGITNQEKKLNILKKELKEYTKVKLIDDNKQTIMSIIKYNKNHKKKIDYKMV